uniref:Uncharacterized protein n=1 Tax=Avena sativa TaxID=4498 RepID=A0ACD5YZU0_AVESA
MDIRSSFISAQSEVPSSWGHGDDCCSWEGITCDNGTRKISRLDLPGIYQLIPTAVGNECWNMNLAIFSSFRELQLLNFSWNFACLQNFEGLQGLSKLKYLDLAENCLLESIPGSFGKLASLKVINLSGNNMIGDLQDAGFENLHNLRELHLGSNNLSGSLPASVFALPSLEYLDLSDNLFEGHIPINLSWSLRELYLSSNRLSGSLPTSLFALPFLQYLDLSHNLFEGHIPINSSWKCSSLLQTIRLSENMLRASGYLSGWLFDGIYFSYQSHYDLQGFTFTTKGNPYKYGRNFFMSMSGIDLSENVLSGEIPPEIGNLSHIKSLNLSNNFITGPIPTTFANMSEIESLDLSVNRLNGPIPWQLTRLSSIAVFSVAYSNLSGCLPDSGQFGSFDMDSYKGNNNLRSCTSSSGPVAPNDTVGNVSDDSDPILYVVTAVSFISAFWATVTFVFCHSFRQGVILKL